VRLSSSGCVCVLTQRWTLQGHSRWLFVLMTVIWITNQGCQPGRRTGMARMRSSDWPSPLAEKTRRHRPAILLNSGGSQIARERNSVLRVRSRTLELKEPCHKRALAYVVDGIYRRINDSVTCGRIHKIGVQLLQCYGVRGPSQSRSPAVDPQSSTRPPWRRFFLQQMLGQSRRPHRHQRER
jgi:hypothetical protein